MTSIATYADDQKALASTSCPTAALLCAIGFFMRILLSGPLLNIFGLSYGSEDASLLAKIHPGTYFIFASFFVLLFSGRNPVDQLWRLAREQTAFLSMIVIYVAILIYWILRGPKGVGMIIDTHLVMPITALVFCYAPKSYCRVIAYLFAAIAIVNSMVGIFESATHIRIFPFDPEWEVLRQDYFRASAFLGHPLSNALFAACSIFVVLSLRMPTVLKSAAFLMMLASLVAFGGRSSLGTCVLGLGVLGLIAAKDRIAHRRSMTVLQMMLTLLVILLVPLACGVLLYAALHSGMGERLMAYNSMSDDSASVRLQAFRLFDYMTPDDLIFGDDGDRIAVIANQAGIDTPLSDIENPWVLMFMFLGGIMFIPWICGLIAFLRKLMSGASPALKIAILEYFLIASTSNSFGRKDPVFLIIIGITVCVKRLNKAETEQSMPLTTKT
jgi:hypothetical protein